MIIYHICAAIAAFLTAFSQILLKMGAVKFKEVIFIRKYLNIYVITAYFLFFCVTLLNLYAYKYLPLKMAIIYLPITFILVALFSIVILKEKMTKKQRFCSAIIILGVIIYNF